MPYHDLCAANTVRAGSEGARAAVGTSEVEVVDAANTRPVTHLVENVRAVNERAVSERAVNNMAVTERAVTERQ